MPPGRGRGTSHPGLGAAPCAGGPLLPTPLWVGLPHLPPAASQVPQSPGARLQGGHTPRARLGRRGQGCPRVLQAATPQPSPRPPQSMTPPPDECSQPTSDPTFLLLPLHKLLSREDASRDPLGPHGPRTTVHHDRDAPTSAGPQASPGLPADLGLCSVPEEDRLLVTQHLARMPLLGGDPPGPLLPVAPATTRFPDEVLWRGRRPPGVGCAPVHPQEPRPVRSSGPWVPVPGLR